MEEQYVCVRVCVCLSGEGGGGDSLVASRGPGIGGGGGRTHMHTCTTLYCCQRHMSVDGGALSCIINIHREKNCRYKNKCQVNVKYKRSVAKNQ